MSLCKVKSDDGKNDYECAFRFRRECDDLSTRPGVRWRMDGKEVIGCSNGILRRKEVK